MAESGEIFKARIIEVQRDGGRVELGVMAFAWPPRIGETLEVPSITGDRSDSFTIEHVHHEPVPGDPATPSEFRAAGRGPKAVVRVKFGSPRK